MGTLLSKFNSVMDPLDQAEHRAALSERQQLVRAVIRRALGCDAEYQRFSGRSSEAPHVQQHEVVDYLFAAPGQGITPQGAFDRLRWGGILVFVAPSMNEVQHVAETFGPTSGFVIEKSPSLLRPSLWGVPLPWGRTVHYFTARKTLLIFPGTTTDRFTYDVQLVKRTDKGNQWVVQKQIPEYSNVMWRLHERFPDVPMETVAQRARKLVDKVFPVFLTREAAFLNILHRDLPKPYCDQVPQVLALEKDKRGLVRRMDLNWLRNGGRQLTQLEFAKQSTDLLRALHDVAQIIHLDLRLDNFVITEHGVGFVDFGSAVRVGEDLSESQMLTTLFEEMMQTSSIQRMLGKMKKAGKVTSRVITASHQKVDKAVDLFYLAVQFNQPHKNPDFKDLVTFDPQSPHAKALEQLTDQILRPQDPENPPYRSAHDVLQALVKMEGKLATAPPRQSPSNSA